MSEHDEQAAEQRGMIATELKGLAKWIESIDKSLESYKQGQGERIEKHGDRITSLEGSVALLNRVAWLLFAASMGVVVTAFFKLIFK